MYEFQRPVHVMSYVGPIPNEVKLVVSVLWIEICNVSVAVASVP